MIIRFKRLILTCGALIKITWWFFRRPRSEGALVMTYANEAKEEILLVKKSYGKGAWSLPGGNRDRDEPIEDTAKRELKEDVGIAVKKLVKIGSFKEYEYFRDHTTHVFESIATDKRVRIDPIELSDAQWFSVQNFPQKCGKSTLAAFKISTEIGVTTS